MTSLGLSNCWQLVYSPSSRLIWWLGPWGGSQGRRSPCSARCRAAAVTPHLAHPPAGVIRGEYHPSQRHRSSGGGHGSDGPTSVLLTGAGAARTVPPAGVSVRLGSEAQFGIVISKAVSL